jgi:hypothetical protein
VQADPGPEETSTGAGRLVARFLDVDGPVRVLDTGAGEAAGDRAVLICVHGLGGSATDWRPLARLLAARHRIVRRAIDLVFAACPDLSRDAFTWIALGSVGRREAVLGPRRGLITRRPETFDVEQGALQPIARWAALTAASSDLGTVDRLGAAAGTEILPAGQAEALSEVLDVLQGRRMANMSVYADPAEWTHPQG